MAAASLFDVDAFDPMALAAPNAVGGNAEAVALGEALFQDPVLSGDGGMSCASCHVPSRAFTDGRPRALSRSGAALRNTPTILNAGLQAGSFHDLRTTYLEDQVTDVIGSAEEMHSSVESAAVRLRGRADYASRFAGAFRDAGDSAITAPNIRGALATYIRSLVRLDSRVDRALRGDVAQLDPAERLGFTLFMGKAKCGTCHFAPLFNGTVPPLFAESEVEVLGVPSRPVTRRGAVGS